MRVAKLLLDENISPSASVALCNEGIDAAHVRDPSMTGATDAEVMEKAYQEDRILVTANVGDFEELARARDIHGGIVLIEDGALLRAEQLAVLRRAVADIMIEYEADRDMVNRVLRIALDGGSSFEPLP